MQIGGPARARFEWAWIIQRFRKCCVSCCSIYLCQGVSHSLRRPSSFLVGEVFQDPVPLWQSLLLLSLEFHAASQQWLPVEIVCSCRGECLWNVPSLSLARDCLSILSQSFPRFFSNRLFGLRCSDEKIIQEDKDGGEKKRSVMAQLIC